MNLVSLKPQRTFGFHFARATAAPKLTGERLQACRAALDGWSCYRDEYSSRHPVGSQ